MTWPAGLQSLTFGEGFATVNLCRPAGHGEGFKSNGFNQSLDKVTWPAGFQRLTFSQNFDQNFGQRDMASGPSKCDFW